MRPSPPPPRSVRRPTRVPRALELPRGPRPPRRTVAEPPFAWPSARAVSVLLVLMVFTAGIAYPGAVRMVADLVTPTSADGSTIVLGQNITDPALFWLRPSLIDWAAFTGAGGEVPYGPLDPGLVNQTRAYLAQYGVENVSVPANLVTPSESGLDPDLYPDAVLVQIPRVAHFSNLSESDLTALVDRFITSPALGVFGPSYVDVVQLDQALLGIEGRTTAASGGA